MSDAPEMTVREVPCQWVFGGPQCGYNTAKHPDARCNKSSDCCIKLGNFERFGGYPIIKGIYREQRCLATHSE